MNNKHIELKLTSHLENGRLPALLCLLDCRGWGMMQILYNLDSPLIYPSTQPHGRLILQNLSLFPTTLDSSKSGITAGCQRERRPCSDSTIGNVVVEGNHAPGCGGDRRHCCRDVEQFWISFYPYRVPEKMKSICARFTDERVPSFPLLLLHNYLLH